MGVLATTTDGRPIEAWAIASARDLAGLSRQAMADELAKLTGDHWSAVMVSRLEQGKKRATYATVVAVAHITGVPIRWFHLHPAEPGDTTRYPDSASDLGVWAGSTLEVAA